MNSKKYKYVDLLINEVKNRPVIWDNKSYQHERRKAMVSEWKAIASKFNKRPDEVKKKWRGLKDTFHLEEKKLKLPTVDEGKPLISYYNGQWAHFEKLIFLYGTRGQVDEYVTSSEHINETDSEIYIEDIKIECETFKHSDESNKKENDSNSKEVEAAHKTPKETLKTTQTNQITNVIDAVKNKNTNDSNKEIIKQKSTAELPMLIIDPLPMITIEPLPMLTIEPLKMNTSTDEDVLFVRSLVPFFRKLNPIRKLIVRNEMQNLVIKEMLCDHCRSVGPQPNCRCNLT